MSRGIDDQSPQPPIDGAQRPRIEGVTALASDVAYAGEHEDAARPPAAKCETAPSLRTPTAEQLQDGAAGAYMSIERAFISRSAVHRRNGDVHQAQINRELPAMMDRVVQHDRANQSDHRKRNDRLAVAHE